MYIYNEYAMKNINQIHGHICHQSFFLEIELIHFLRLELTFTLWEVTDSYLVGGMPLVDLVDLLTLKDSD